MRKRSSPGALGGASEVLNMAGKKHGGRHLRVLDTQWTPAYPSFVWAEM